jgi:hypothetical protein
MRTPLGASDHASCLRRTPDTGNKREDALFEKKWTTTKEVSLQLATTSLAPKKDSRALSFHLSTSCPILVVKSYPFSWLI